MRILTPEAIGGPATVTMRTLTIAPGEVLDVSSDVDHHRTVFTVRGPAGGLAECVAAAAEVAAERVGAFGAQVWAITVQAQLAQDPEVVRAHPARPRVGGLCEQHAVELERVPPKILEVRDLVVRYGAVTAVDDVDLTVRPGTIVGRRQDAAMRRRHAE